MKPSINRIASDLVEIRIGLRTYHIQEEDSPVLGIAKFVEGKQFPMVEGERKHMLIHYQRFREKEEFG